MDISLTVLWPAKVSIKTKELLLTNFVELTPFLNTKCSTCLNMIALHQLPSLDFSFCHAIFSLALLKPLRFVPHSHIFIQSFAFFS